MNLVASAASTKMLTGNPSTSFFKTTYAKHTPFGTQKFRLDFDGERPISQTEPTVLNFKVPRNADLLYKCFFVVTVPDIYSDYACTASECRNGSTPEERQDYQFAWVKRLGNTLIQDVSVYIGGSLIESYTGERLTILESLNPSGDPTLAPLMTGDVPALYAPSSSNCGVYPTVPPLCLDDGTLVRCAGQYPSIRARTLYIPLGAWFCAAPCQALPLVALQYHQAEIRVTIRPFQELYTIASWPSLPAYEIEVPVVLLLRLRREGCGEPHDVLPDELPGCLNYAFKPLVEEWLAMFKDAYQSALAGRWPDCTPAITFQTQMASVELAIRELIETAAVQPDRAAVPVPYKLSAQVTAEEGCCGLTPSALQSLASDVASAVALVLRRDACSIDNQGCYDVQVGKDVCYHALSYSKAFVSIEAEFVIALNETAYDPAGLGTTAVVTAVATDVFIQSFDWLYSLKTHLQSRVAAICVPVVGDSTLLTVYAADSFTEERWATLLQPYIATLPAGSVALPSTTVPFTISAPAGHTLPDGLALSTAVEQAIADAGGQLSVNAAPVARTIAAETTVVSTSLTTDTISLPAGAVPVVVSYEEAACSTACACPTPPSSCAVAGCASCAPQETNRISCPQCRTQEWLSPQAHPNPPAFEHFLQNGSLATWCPEPHILADYIFLGQDERELFARTEQRYLVRQPHHEDFYSVAPNGRVDIASNGTVASHMWRLRRSDAWRRNEWTNFSNFRYDNVPNVPYRSPSCATSSSTFCSDQPANFPPAQATYPGFNFWGVPPTESPYFESNAEQILVDAALLVNGEYRENVFPGGVWEYASRPETDTDGAILQGVYYLHYALNYSQSGEASGALPASSFDEVTLQYSTIVPPLVKPPASTPAVTTQQTILATIDAIIQLQEPAGAFVTPCSGPVARLLGADTFVTPSTAGVFSSLASAEQIVKSGDIVGQVQPLPDTTDFKFGFLNAYYYPILPGAEQVNNPVPVQVGAQLYGLGANPSPPGAGLIVSWHKQDGETVTIGQTIATFRPDGQTDTQLLAQIDGTLKLNIQALVQFGATFEPFNVLTLVQTAPFDGTFTSLVPPESTSPSVDTVIANIFASSAPAPQPLYAVNPAPARYVQIASDGQTVAMGQTVAAAVSQSVSAGTSGTLAWIVSNWASVSSAQPVAIIDTAPSGAPPLHVHDSPGCADSTTRARLAAADAIDQTTACDAWNRASGAAVSDGVLAKLYQYTYDLRVYTESYNVLVVQGGMAGLEYAL